jgi:uncharacterized membrane protein
MTMREGEGGFASGNVARRVLWLDVTRGIGVFAMVCYHIVWDFRFFGIASPFPEDSLFWRAGHFLISGVFFYCCGAGLRAGAVRGVGGVFLRRLIPLTVACGVVSFLTFLAFPSGWIYFGVLHAILICILLCSPFRVTPRLAGVVGCGGVIIFVLTDWTWAPIPLTGYTLDYVVVFPWVVVVLFGIASFDKVNQIFSGKKRGSGQWSLWLSWMGKRSLAIYLLHQPVLFALLWLFQGTSKIFAY